MRHRYPIGIRTTFWIDYYARSRREGHTALSITISVIEALWSRLVAARLADMTTQAAVVTQRVQMRDSCAYKRIAKRMRRHATDQSMAVATRVGTFAPAFDWVLVQA